MQIRLLFFVVAMNVSLSATFSAEIMKSNSPTKKSYFNEMACNDWVNLSLDTNCQALVTLDMLLENITGSTGDYEIQLWKGDTQIDLSLDATDYKKVYTFKVIHLPSGNSCWGKINVEDKLAPTMACGADTLRCGGNISPTSLGFPIPAWILADVTMKPDPKIPNTYEMENWDVCSPVTVTYEDEVQNFGCDSMFSKVILRHWTVTDIAGNVGKCDDTIFIKLSDFSDVVLPPDYDGIIRPMIKCYDTYPKLPNGHPDPIYTGYPVPNGCDKLIASYSDLKIDICENTYKILRRWVILDWCSKEVREVNQIIKVVDDKGPEFNVPPDVFVGMKVYSCESYGILPVPENVNDCSSWIYNIYTKQIDSIGNYTATTTKFVFWNPIEKVYYIDGAPIGRIWVIYELIDDCGNMTSKQIEVAVEDELLPVPVCDEKTVVTLTTDGKARVFAETFDNGSLDNCGIYDFEVRRMIDQCGNGTDVFGDYVDFCCEDVGDTLMIVLKVIDNSRNENTCMVEIIVQEKEKPKIIAPSDVTISCTFDRSNLSLFGSVKLSEADRNNIIIRDANYYSFPNFIAGKDGLATDNCFVTITEVIDSSIICNQGYIRRIFTATDRQGLTETSIQTISIRNPIPFGRNNIFFPGDIPINSCRPGDIDPSITGAPTFNNSNCANIVISYDDKLYHKIDTSCYKIFRTWTVLDWCQFNPRTNEGVWTETQIIYVSNSRPPDIFSCNDVEFCDLNAYYDPNRKACLVAYDLKGEAEDDCTKKEHLIWKYRIDTNNDGVYDRDGLGGRLTGNAPVGVFKVEWIVEDLCGNINRCTQTVTLKDCKKPSPYCHNGIVTVIMPLNGVVSVWAKDLDINSSDNCTSNENLKFSFSPDINNTSITYNCDSMQKKKSITKTVRMYVTDESGNQDYCEVSIVLQDNNDVCTGTFANVSGKIQRENQTPIRDVEVSLKNGFHAVMANAKSNVEGIYSFTNIPIGQEYYIDASKTDDVINGISTYDIVLIQRNILGKQLFNSALQYLAADVNNSNSVTSRDISDLRKLILGVKDDLPCKSSWNFIPKAFQFQDISNPWEVESKIFLADVKEVLDIQHFTAYKKGDIDNSAELELNRTKSRSNSVEWLIGDPIKLDSKFMYPVFSTSELNIDGFQLKVKANEIHAVAAEALDIQEYNVSINSDNLTMSWNADKAIHVLANEVLFYIECASNKAKFNQVQSMFVSELYQASDIRSLMINRSSSIAEFRGFDLGQNIPNPYFDRTMIPVEASKSAAMTLTVMDLTGKTVLIKSIMLDKGTNYITLDKSMFVSEGVYLYKLEGSLGTQTRKMILK
ncbi:MAG: T9SS type A sorting domain-containing protein [Saprospiraceae bacterium]|nr:T9SS type A sorting domain-containing protein [Saprospiraceae bacterium]